MKKKLVSVSQVLYINNICLIPKLEYLLQHVYLTKEEYEKIQQLYIIIAKNKIGLARTVPTCIISHSGILNMRMLWNVMKTKQTLSLINRLNSKSDIRNITELRIRQGQGLLGYASNIWTENIGEDEAKLLKNNLACLIIQENLNIGLEIIANRENWSVKVDGRLIKSLLKKKTFVKVAKILQEMKIVVLEQLLNIEGTHLITWQQLEVSRKRPKKGKKASWYEEIEGEVLRN